MLEPPPRGARLLILPPPRDVSLSPSFLAFSARSEAGEDREVVVLVGVSDAVLGVSDAVLGVLVADDDPPDAPVDVAVEPEE